MAHHQFEELDRADTPIGHVSLRRRVDPTLGAELFEVKLDDEYLMSSLFTESETQLARLALAELPAGSLEVLVGGLGLGYTARAVLQDPRVRTLRVVELLDVVIDWHRRHLLPLGPELTADPRCRLAQGDFFAAMAGDAAVAGGPDRWHAILVDIDHSPRHLLDARSATFYRPEGLGAAARHLHPGGVFALWSDHPTDGAFVDTAQSVFGTCDAHVVRFANPYTGGESSSTVYVAAASL